MSQGRTELHREIVEALIQSKAIDFEAVGGVLGKFGPRAALAGIPLGVIITRRVMDACIPPDPYLTFRNVEQLVSALRGSQIQQETGELG